LWVAAAIQQGELLIGTEGMAATIIKPEDRTVFVRAKLSANDSIRLRPGEGGCMAVRLVEG
jgi:hypothetical protein